MKYIIEIENTPFGNPERDLKLYKCAQFNSLVFDAEGLSRLTPYTEPDRKAIEDAQEEVWNFASKIILSASLGGLTTDEIKDCFGNENVFFDVLRDFSYQEAKAKYDAWKKKKNEIRVGDEVIPMDTEYDTMIVTRTWKDDYWSDCVNTIGFDGSICSFLTSNVKKTGRHFDEVEELLKKIKE